MTVGIGNDGQDDGLSLHRPHSTIDLLLPTFPWVEQSILRAQDNLIDYGFAKFPTVTPEDIIIAKVFALSIEENRFTDMDDIQSILATNNQLDLLYLVQELERLNLSFPKALESQLPKVLRQISKRKSATTKLHLNRSSSLQHLF